MMAHTFDPSSWEAEAGLFLWVQNQSWRDWRTGIEISTKSDHLRVCPCHGQTSESIYSHGCLLPIIEDVFVTTLVDKTIFMTFN